MKTKFRKREPGERIECGDVLLFKNHFNDEIIYRAANACGLIGCSVFEHTPRATEAYEPLKPFDEMPEGYAPGTAHIIENFMDFLEEV